MKKLTTKGLLVACCILAIWATGGSSRVTAAVVSDSPPAAPARPPAGPPPITADASEEEIRNGVAAVRAGRKLTPSNWPNNARVVVCITVDVDNESLARNRPLPVPLSNGEYGATTGLPGILGLLEREQVPATFFVPAMSPILHPEIIPAIQKSGRNEIGMHGWVHESWPDLGGDAAAEEKLINKSIDYLTRVTGKRPVGVRSPSSALSTNSVALLKKAGFLYDSSLEARDEVYEIDSYGKPSGLIEVPMNNIMNDFRYYGGDSNGGLMSPELLFDVYKAEFDMAYEEGSLVTFMLHPHVSGHRSRVAQVRKFIEYMKAKPGVWFTTMHEVASYAKEHGAVK
ncbi:MAG TPA: polysaccharide deacetylase [Steroidobacteraceae bacterium]